MAERFQSHPYDVLILGGGVAGLAAAVGVVEAGLRPLVLEAARQPGGRARSFYDRQMGEILDNGPHLLIGGYHATLRLLEKLGTRNRLAASPTVSYQFWRREAGWYGLNCPDWPAPLHLLAGVMTFPAFSLRDRLTTLRLGPALCQSRATLEKKTVTQWLHGAGQAGTVFETLWAPLCLATLNEPAGSANAALFAEVLSQSFFHNRHNARPLVPTVPLSQLIAEPASALIEKKGGLVLCGERVKSIRMERGFVVGVTTGRWDFSLPPALISALPYDALSKLVPLWAEKAGFARLSSAPIVSVHLTYDGPITLPAPLVGLPFETSQWLFDRSLQHPDSQEGAGRISGVMSGAYRESHWSKKKLMETVAADLQRLLPQRDRSRLVGARVVKERRATFSPWPHSSELRPGGQTPWKNMRLAGDWTATHLPATLEGAVLSGEAAVEKVLAFLADDG
ncbi:MAG: FAD-dependent oxidoreductase [Magnetococcales bacterium]|nr:FAD-dependent oxidoreductase [Magnetococcales bacterium]